MPTAPPVIRTTRPLPFNDLTPEDFERMCYWLVEREGFKSVQYLGEAGADRGVDIAAARDGRRFAFQCKRVKQFGPRAVETEIEKLRELPAGEQVDDIVFIVSRAMSIKARETAYELWGKGRCHFWAGSELDKRVKKHPEILEEFFDLGIERPTPKYANDVTRRLARALDDAYRLRAEFSASGKDTAEVIERILTLRRRLRQGAQLKAGDYLLDGRFQLLEEIGHGGFAQVWKAFDCQRHSQVAVKVLHGQHTGDRSRRERFFRGARQMARLTHPNVVRVIEEKCEDGEYPFFIMEYLGGGDLRHAVLEGRFSHWERLQIILEVGEALALAHRRGVIHRDLKPHNILLTPGGTPKLTDFDLVRAADTTGGTRTAMLGTFLYASPEAMADARQAAEPADVYGLGMTAIFVLYGADLPSNILWDLSELVSGLEASDRCIQVLLKAVARKVEERWGTIEEFCEALSEALSATPTLPIRAVAGQEHLHERDDSVLVYVPGGEVCLGTNEDLGDFDEKFQKSWKPEHHAMLSPYWIGKYPVTNEQYSRFLSANPGHREPVYWDDRRFNDPRQPVIGLCWLDARAYCNWAGLELPTEAQWEAAARGTDGRPYPWGSENPTSEHADFGKNYRKDKPDPVGSHPRGAGPYGTQDQAGNVWEWCLDEFKRDAYQGRDGQKDPVVKPTDDGENADRVVRGGDWYYPPSFLHVAFRGRFRAGVRYRGVGFRVCRLGPTLET